MKRPHLGSLGFTLLETLVALSLLAVAMLLTLSLVYQEPRVLRRLDAHEQALQALEQVTEAIRAGRTVGSGRQLVDSSWLHLPEDPAAQDLEVWSELVEASGSGLFELTLTAHYRVGQRRFERSLETLVWEPQ